MKLNIPTSLTVVLSAIAGVIVAFVSSGIIVLEAPWSEAAQVSLTVLAAWGISPLTGAAFRAILHLTNGISTVIAATLGGLQVVFMQVHMSTALHGLLAGVLAFAAGLGFAPSLNLARFKPGARGMIGD